MLLALFTSVLVYCRRFLFSIPYRLSGVTYAEPPSFMVPELIACTKIIQLLKQQYRVQNTLMATLTSGLYYSWPTTLVGHPKGRAYKGVKHIRNGTDTECDTNGVEYSGAHTEWDTYGVGNIRSGTHTEWDIHTE